MDRKQYEKLAKRINQRMLRAYRSGSTNKEFDLLQAELWAAGATTGTQYRTAPSRAKQMSQEMVDKIGAVLKKYDSKKLYTGKAAKEQKLTDLQKEYQQVSQKLNKQLSKLPEAAKASYAYQQYVQDVEREGVASAKKLLTDATKVNEQQARAGIAIARMYLTQPELNPKKISQAMLAIYDNLGKWASKTGQELTDRQKFAAAYALQDYVKLSSTTYDSGSLIASVIDVTETDQDKKAEDIIAEAMRQWEKDTKNLVNKYGSFTRFLQKEFLNF